MSAPRLSVAALVCCAVGSLGATAASATDLVYGSWVSPKHSVMRTAMPPFFAAVKKATNGTINWKMVGGGQLVDAKGTVPGLKDGLIDGGFVIPSFGPSYTPTTSLVFNTQVFGDDPVAATGAQSELVLLRCPQCLAEARKMNFIPLGSYSTSPFLLMCRMPVATLADLKGLKVRAAGGGIGVTRLAGMTPVTMSPADATQALQRGGLDCVLGAASWLRSYGYQDVVKTVIDYPLGMSGPSIHLAINRTRFRAMTPAQRKAHVDAAAEAAAIATIDGYILYEKTIVEAAKKKGVKFVKGGAEFEAVATRREAEQREANIKASANLNVPNPGPVLDAYEAAVKKWRALSKEIGTDTKKFTEALQREIYSKLDPEKL
ncbi:MAG: TRAP transporter substrate-binding protein DctP [Hyphomicrobiaceae bacterium]